MNGISDAAVLFLTGTVDYIAEPEEHFTASLTGVSGAGLGSPAAGVVTIKDVSPTVNVSAPATLGEGGEGTVTVSRTGENPNQALTVTLKIAGTASPQDYTLGGQSFSPGGTLTVTMPAGQLIPPGPSNPYGYSYGPPPSVNLPLVVKRDNLVEGDETIVVEVLGGSGYHEGSGATVTLADDPPVVTVASTGSLSEDTVNGPTGGGFVFTRTGGDLAAALTVDYMLHGGATGVALNGIDYNPLPGVPVADPAHPEADLYGQVTIPGSTSDPAPSVFVLVVVKPDGVNESSESITVEVIPPGSAPGSTPANPATYSLGSPYLAVLLIADATPTILVAGADNIPINANNDNWKSDSGQPQWMSAAQPGIPNKRDFDATNLWQDDPQLKPISISVGGGFAGKLTAQIIEPGDARIEIWADPRKKEKFVGADLEAGQLFAKIVYIEGTYTSSNLQDTSDAYFTFTPTGRPAAKVKDEKHFIVTPVILSLSPPSIPGPSVTFRNQPDNNGLAGITASKPPVVPGGKATHGITFDAEVANDGMSITYVQDQLGVINGFNDGGPAIALVDPSEGRNFAIRSDLKYPDGSQVTFPLLDTKPGAVGPSYANTRLTPMDGDTPGVRVTADNSPQWSYNSVEMNARVSKIDFKSTFACT